MINNDYMITYEYEYEYDCEYKYKCECEHEYKYKYKYRYKRKCTYESVFLRPAVKNRFSRPAVKNVSALGRLGASCRDWKLIHITRGCFFTAGRKKTPTGRKKTFESEAARGRLRPPESPQT